MGIFERRRHRARELNILEWFRQQVEQAGGGNYQSLVNTALHLFVQSQNLRPRGPSSPRAAMLAGSGPANTAGQYPSDAFSNGSESESGSGTESEPDAESESDESPRINAGAEKL